eukprot:TRINITY_DN3163_c0_g4_i4.p1 TRINITY_DN3163_c0_g4~~TRINITY_DN3163_c0_g4_i4.p1  ORF type:complete len:1310 (+),score=404.69 TRINITY_DN3163_c0_g4_i4:220-4149(+)
MLKQVKRSAALAWSPNSDQLPASFAAATVTGTVDLSFDTTATLEIFAVDTAKDDSDIPVIGRRALPERVSKLVWGRTGITGGTYKQGLLVGGHNNGSVSFWDPSKISAPVPTQTVTESKSSNEEDFFNQAAEQPTVVADPDDGFLVSSVDRHSGPVSAMGFNAFQDHILATGSVNNEVLIWDLTNPSAPNAYTPGTAANAAPGSGDGSQVTSVAWNKKVAHILAAQTYTGPTVIWDLKNKRPVIQFRDPNSKNPKCRAVAWNPCESTQIVTASEDDAYPHIQVWDLRNTYAPSRYFQGHTRGIWALSWSAHDPSLLISCGKDNRTVCWNTNTGECLSDIASPKALGGGGGGGGGGDVFGGAGGGGSSWNFDVQWAPSLTGVMATCSLEGTISVQASSDFNPVQRSAPATSDDPFAAPTPAAKPLQPPPTWLRRPAGVSFGFGGRLVSFRAVTGEGGVKKQVVNVAQVVTEPTLLERAKRLQSAMHQTDLRSFCDEKMASAAGQNERSTWAFLKVLFEDSSRAVLINHLGFSSDTVAKEIDDFLKVNGIDVNNNDDAVAAPEPKAATPPPAVVEEVASTPPPASDGDDVTGLFGGSEGGGDVFDLSGPPPPAQTAPAAGGDSLFDELAAAGTPPAPTPSAAAPPVAAAPAKKMAEIHFTSDSHEPAENLVARALMLGNFEAAVECCMRTGRVADALILAYTGGTALWNKTQAAYFDQHQEKKPFLRVVSSIVRSELDVLVQNTSITNWRETLAALCTYAQGADSWNRLCQMLARRLDDGGDKTSATLCYIAAGDAVNTLSHWDRDTSTSFDDLQDFIEKASVFRRGHATAVPREATTLLAEKHSQYAEMLAEQGQLETAIDILESLSSGSDGAPPTPIDPSSDAGVLLDRIYHALGRESSGSVAPPSPWGAFGAGAPMGQQQDFSGAATLLPPSSVGQQAALDQGSLDFGDAGAGAGFFDAQQVQVPQQPQQPPVPGQQHPQQVFPGQEQQQQQQQQQEQQQQQAAYGEQAYGDQFQQQPQQPQQLQQPQLTQQQQQPAFPGQQPGFLGQQAQQPAIPGQPQQPAFTGQQQQQQSSFPGQQAQPAFPGQGPQQQQQPAFPVQQPSQSAFPGQQQQPAFPGQQQPLQQQTPVTPTMFTPGQSVAPPSQEPPVVAAPAPISNANASPEALAIINAFTTLLSTLTASVDQKQQRVLKDAGDRLAEVFGKLSADQLSEQTVSTLTQLAQCLTTRDQGTANTLLTQHSGAFYTELGMKATLGLKKLKRVIDEEIVKEQRQQQPQQQQQQQQQQQPMFSGQQQMHQQNMHAPPMFR